MEVSFWGSLAQLLGRREPKTPMSFYTRFLLVVISAIVAPTYSSIGETAKLFFLSCALLLGAAILIWVGVLTWCRPENLLFGADTHFEKWKMGFGTDKGPATKSELKQSVSNPQAGLK